MPFTLIQTSDQNLQLIQNNIATALNPLQLAPLTAGTILGTLKNPIVLKTGQNNPIPHYLGRFPTFFFAGIPSSQSTIWYTSVDATNLNIHCSADCTVLVWVN